MDHKYEFRTFNEKRHTLRSNYGSLSEAFAQISSLVPAEHGFVISEGNYTPASLWTWVDMHAVKECFVQGTFVTLSTKQRSDWVDQDVYYTIQDAFADLLNLVKRGDPLVNIRLCSIEGTELVYLYNWSE